MTHMKNPQLATAIGDRIRELRKEAGVTSQEGLADCARVDRTYIGRLERGECGATLAEFFRLFVKSSRSKTRRKRS